MYRFDCFSLFGLINVFQCLLQNNVNNSLWYSVKMTVHKKQTPNYGTLPDKILSHSS